MSMYSRICGAVVGLAVVAVLLASCTSSSDDAVNSPPATARTSPITGAPETLTQSAMGASASPVESSGAPFSVPAGHGSTTTGASSVLMAEDGTGVLTFGMTEDEFRQVVSSNGWEYQVVPNASNAKTISIGHDDFMFSNGALDSFSIVDGKFATGRGLRVGDTLGRMKQLYGTDYNQSTSSGQQEYMYVFPSQLRLSVVFKKGENTVMAWVLLAPVS